MTSRERALRVALEHYEITIEKLEEDSERHWPQFRRLRESLIAEFNAVAKEAAERMRHECLEWTGAYNSCDGVAEKIAAKIRALPVDGEKHA